MELKHVKYFDFSQRKLPRVYHLNKPSLTMYINAKGRFGP